MWQSRAEKCRAAEKGNGKMDIYQLLAPFYAKFNSDVAYDAMADYLDEKFRRFFPGKVASVLDLGCGSGNMTFPLLQKGYDMIGVDISPEMLSVARGAEGGARVLWLCQDMTDFELYGTVEAVVSTLDGINHLESEAEVKKCFSLVHNYLVPGGLFAFDINMPYKFRHVYGKNAYFFEEKDVFCAWQNYFHPRNGFCDFYITLFEKKGRLYERHDARMREKMFAPEKIREWLSGAGFTLLSETDGYTDNRPTETTQRLVFIARAEK